MKKIVMICGMLFILTGCGFNASLQPGDCDFIGPLEKGSAIEEDCIN